MEYGSIPDWLAGAGTVGALAVALVLLSHDLRARREVEEDRRPGAGQPGADLPHASAWIVFTDTSNQRWQRGHSGRLSRLVEQSTQQRRSVKDRLDAYAGGQVEDLDY